MTFKPNALAFGASVARNIAEADETEHLAFEAAQRHDRRHFPAAGLHQLVGERHLAGERQQQRHGVVRHFAQAIIRHVVDGDAALLRRRQVDIVDAKPEAADRLAARELPQQLAGKFCIGDEDGVGVARHGENVVGGRALRHAIFGIEPRQRFFRGVERRKDAVGDGDRGLGIGFSDSTPSPRVRERRMIQYPPTLEYLTSSRSNRGEAPHSCASLPTSPRTRGEVTRLTTQKPAG